MKTAPITASPENFYDAGVPGREGAFHMHHNPLTTIVIPTYNDIHLVCDAIDCSLNQTYKNLEIIVVDDGSSDGTGRLLKEKYGEKIIYIHQENRGLSSARNAGIRRSSGKYIQFLDSDDLIDLNKISIQVGQLEKLHGPALAYSDYIRTPLGDMTIRFSGRMSPVLQVKKPFDDLMMKWETELSIPPHCFLFDAALFKDHGILFDESLPTHEDWECWMSVFSVNPTVVFTDAPLANYRRRTDSMCTNIRKMRDGYLMAIDRQIHKNRLNRNIVIRLKIRRKKIKYLYRSAGPLMRVKEKCRQFAKKIYSLLIPHRIRHERRYGKNYAETTAGKS